MAFDISVIIPTYKRQDFIFQSIDSALLQHGLNVKVIVIDDDPQSTLGGLIKKKYGEDVEYYQNKENVGPSASRKFGLQVAETPFVVFMDDDDYYTNYSFFELAVQILSANTHLAFVGSNAKDFDQKSGKILDYTPLSVHGIVRGKAYLDQFGRSMPKPKSTFTSVFRRENLLKSVLIETGEVNDTVIYLCALTVGDAYLAELICGNYRIHESNITKSISAQFILRTLVAKRYIATELPYSYFGKLHWLYRQAMQSINYFLVSSSKSADIGIIVNWATQQPILIAIPMWLKICKWKIESRLHKEKE